MNRKLRTAMFILLALAFLVSAAMMAYQTIQYQEGDKTYAEAEALVDLPDLTALPVPPAPANGGSSGSSSDSSSAQPSAQEAPSSGEPAPVYVDPYADALRNMDFTALREVNGDVLGWILIPGTRLSYPLVQGEDNSYYLNHTWRKGRNSVGAIFLECTNSGDLSNFNTIIYGHRMNNRSMFGSLSSYQDHTYWSSHPAVYITDDNGSHKYEIFAAYEVSVEGDTYRLGLSSDQSKQSFIDYCLAQSVLDTGVVPTVYDRILTLSTCTGNGHATRWVVQGVLRGVAPPDTAQQRDPQEPDAADSPSPDESGPLPQGEPSDSSEQPLDEPPVSQDIPRVQDGEAPAPSGESPRQEAPSA